MIKIFRSFSLYEDGSGDPDSSNEAVNFVDDNNLAVGYRFDSDCCEQYGYEFREDLNVPTSIDSALVYFDQYVFDKNFFCDKVQPPISKIKEDGSIEWNEDFNAVAFRLANKQCLDHLGSSLYLVLYNIHNGYYAHGFEFKDAEGKEIQKGNI